jgi:hypothetical protein
MTTQEIKGKLTAILSADVKGYNRLIAKDEAGTLQTLNTRKNTILQKGLPKNIVEFSHARRSF